MFKGISLYLLAITSIQSVEQTVPVRSDSPIIPVPSANSVLRVGTEVALKLTEELTTKDKHLKTGQRFRLETAEAVFVQGVLVIPTGSQAVGEIVEVRNKGMWGKSGHFSAQVRYLTVNGRQIRLSGTFDDKGTAGGIGAVAVSAIVFPPAGFFMTGTSAQLPIGTPVKAFIDEDVVLSFPNQGPVPLQVAAPQAAVVEVPKAVVSSVAPATDGAQTQPAASTSIKP